MSSPRSYPVKKGEQYRFQIESLAPGGVGVTHREGYTVFVPGGLPGQTVDGTVIRRRKSYAEARIDRMVEPSPDQVETRCDHFGRCGGCQLQHYDYAAQLRAKRDQVAETLRRVGGLEIEVEQPLEAPAPYAYRNKMEYSFSNSRWLEPEEIERGVPMDRFGLGLHLKGRYDRILDIRRCHLQHEAGSEILRKVRDGARAGGLPAYSTRTHDGFWRFLVIREGVRTGERMVHVITHVAEPGSPEMRQVQDLGRSLFAGGFGITSLLHGQTARKASVAVCESVSTLAGDPVIHEEVLGLRFEIGPNTFFQTNTEQAERLFQAVLDRGRFEAAETVWDLYCGVGAISLPIARRVRRVRGLELMPEAVAAAGANATANGIDNAVFETSDLRALPEPTDRPDAIVLDPPRTGVHPETVGAILALAAPRIVYVSCNPATLARDLALFRDGGYALGPVLPVDMFPHTAHVECVTTLALADPRPSGSR